MMYLMRDRILACLSFVLVASLLMGPRPAVSQGVVALFNTRLPGDGVPWAAGDWAAFAVPEESRDLNGDGDTEDDVLFVADVLRLQARTLGAAVNSALIADEEHPPVAIAGATLVALVSESNQANRDLNGDGDAKDNVLHVFDLAARTVTRTGLAGEEVQIWGTSACLLTPEEEGQRDLNGDGDIGDKIFQVYDTKTGQTWNSGLSGTSFYLAEDRAAVMTAESRGGVMRPQPGAAPSALAAGRDLNGDGDASDVVAQLVNLKTHKIDNSRMDSSFAVALTPRLFASAVSEARQGGKDLNGDGDTADHVLMVVDLSNMQTIPTTWDASGDVVASGTLVAFVTEEPRQGVPQSLQPASAAVPGKPALRGQDLNADGDARDGVAQIFDLTTRTVTNLGQDASQGILVSNGRVAMITDEANQARRDLNGDKDTNDLVVQMYDVTRARLSCLKTAVGGAFAFTGNLLAFSIVEEDQGKLDLNGDRDTDDEIVHVYDAGSGRLMNSRQACLDIIATSDRAAAFFTSEYDQGVRDLNGNGNAEDNICQVYRIR